MTDTDSAEAFELPATTGVGRVALRVESLDRVVPFYRDIVGFDVDARDDGPGACAHLAVGGEALLVLEESPSVPERGDDEAGLFHLAFRVPDRGALADALGRVRRGGG